MAKKIGIIGDFNERLKNHTAINEALTISRQERYADLDFEWLSTKNLHNSELSNYNGLWLAPGGPYQSDENVLAALKWIRESKHVPFLGNCSGFQYGIIEFMKNVIGFVDVNTEEVDAHAANKVVSQLSCSLHGNISQSVFINEGTKDGEARILELPDHDFYFLTLFQPAMNTSNEHPHPLITAFLQKCL
ncbi:MAG: synthase [Bacillus sp. (in: firmicutes)]|nr:synthase [Bacillus sp. (in: firmicutes)]